MVQAPKIDSRTAGEIAAQVRYLLEKYTDGKADPAKGVGAALVSVFTRYAELIIERLNRVPEKNFLAFLDLLGASPMPPQPARAPLTFKLSEGSKVEAVVPAGTQVAAAPGEGESEPVIFETERELVVTPAQLTSIFVRDPENDRSSIVDQMSSNGVALFKLEQPELKTERILYIAHDALFGHPGLKSLKLNFVIAQGSVGPLTVNWERWTGTKWDSFQANQLTDGTLNLTRAGDVTFTNVSQFLRTAVNGIEKFWLRCSLAAAIPPAPSNAKFWEPPTITSVRVKDATLSRNGLQVEHAIVNDAPVDMVKGFFPFGERPKIGDTFYLSVKEAFSEPNSSVTLRIKLARAGIGYDKLRLRWEFWNGQAWTNLGEFGWPQFDASDFSDAAALIQALKGTDKLAVYLRGKFDPKTVDSLNQYTTPPPPAELIDSLVVEFNKLLKETALYDQERFASVTQRQQTQNLRQKEPKTEEERMRLNRLLLEDAYSQIRKAFAAEMFTADGDVSFLLSNPAAATIGGVTSFWVRVRIVEGNYGKEAYYEPKNKNDLNAGFKSVDATLSPPLINSITVDYTVTKTAAPEVLLTYNDFEYQEVTTARAFRPFRLMTDTSPTVYLGFHLPAGREAFPQRKISVFADLYENKYQFGDSPAPISPGRDSPTDSGQPQLEWEYSTYSTRTGWAKLLISDSTESFTKSGLLEFFGSGDFARRSEFGRERYWIRAAWKSGQYPFAPRLRRVLLNTTMAAQTTTIRDEVLGSSDGNRNQKFQTTRAPIIQTEQLEVREPEQPSALEQKRIKKDAGEQRVTTDSGVWVRWTEVADFYASAPRDRHYVVDHLTGEIHFGDGARGMIPPTGSGSIRLSEYRIGGGVTGNKPAGSITQLKTTVPYVESVTNHLPARGGAAAEALASVMERAPRSVRHRDRAVTLEDYEDLARLASPEVARAHCVPLFDLSKSPISVSGTIKPGTVSLIIVPRSSAVTPTPSIELIDRVRGYLDARRSPTSDLVIVGPRYISVGVTVELALTSMEGAREVETAALTALARFLHPLTGGWDGTGWYFDRRPHKSDLYALIEGIKGVGHVASLTVTPDEDSNDFKTDRFLVSSGEHRISLKLEEASAARLRR